MIRYLGSVSMTTSNSCIGDEEEDNAKKYQSRHPAQVSQRRGVL
jgi:hypothetical protein